jgi:hypothetical protein
MQPVERRIEAHTTAFRALRGRADPAATTQMAIEDEVDNEANPITLDMTMAIDAKTVAQELIDAYEAGEPAAAAALGTRRFLIWPPPTRWRRNWRAAAARADEPSSGRKVAFGNHAVLEKLNLKTVAWASMYDDTVHQASEVDVTPLPFAYAPKLEPEIVFKLKSPVKGDPVDSVAVLKAVEWPCARLRNRRLPLFPNGSSSRQESGRGVRLSCRARARLADDGDGGER